MAVAFQRSAYWRVAEPESSAWAGVSFPKKPGFLLLWRPGKSPAQLGTGELWRGDSINGSALLWGLKAGEGGLSGCTEMLITP